MQIFPGLNSSDIDSNTGVTPPKSHVASSDKYKFSQNTDSYSLGIIALYEEALFL